MINLKDMESAKILIFIELIYQLFLLIQLYSQAKIAPAIPKSTKP